MRIQIFDSATNKVAGEVDVPDEIVEAACKVERWMQQNGCQQLCGLKVASAMLRDAMTL